MHRRRFAATILLIVILFSPAARSQALCVAVGGIRALPISDEGACIQQLAPGVYVIIHSDASDEWPHGNTGIIEGRQSLFVIDSTYLPSRARADIALIRRLTPKPVGYLTTTHWHMDHNNGAVEYRDAFPRLTYLVERNTARWMVINQVYWSHFSSAQGGTRRAAVAALEQRLAKGLKEDGTALSATEHTQLQQIIAQRKNELEELGGLRVAEATRTFDDVLQLTFEGRSIEIRNRGRANSPSDTTFYLRGERILFTGDIVVQSPLPFVGASYPYDWVRVLQQIESMPVRMLVPGHGPVMTDLIYLGQVRSLIEAAVSRVQGFLAEGRSLDQAKKEIHFDDIRSQVPIWNDPAIDPADWEQTRTALIERAWKNIRGQEN